MVYERFGFSYNSRGQLLVEKSRQLQGADWIYSHTTNYYNDTGFISGTTATPGAITGSTSTGSSSGMQLYYSQTKYWKNGTVVGGTGVPAYGGSNDTAAGDSSLKNTLSFSERFGWQQSYQEFVNQYGTGYSYWNYGLDGAIKQVDRYSTTSWIEASFYYVTDVNGLIVRQWESLSENSASPASTAPQIYTYRFGGKEIGQVGNNSTTNTDYATLIDRRDDTPGTGCSSAARPPARRIRASMRTTSRSPAGHRATRPAAGASMPATRCNRSRWRCGAMPRSGTGSRSPTAQARPGSPKARCW